MDKEERERGNNRLNSKRKKGKGSLINKKKTKRREVVRVVQ